MHPGCSLAISGFGSLQVRGIGSGSVQQPFHDRNLQERNPLRLQKGLFIRGRCPFDIPLLRFSKMNLEGLFRKIDTHILEVLLHKIMNCLKCLRGINPGLFLPSILFDEERGNNLLNPGVSADRTVDNASRLLLLVGCVIFEPALKQVAMAADQIEGNHLSSLAVLSI